VDYSGKRDRLSQMASRTSSTDGSAAGAVEGKRMSADKRTEHLLLAKVAEQAERYDDAVEHLRAIVSNARSLHLFNYESARLVTQAFF